MHVCFQGFAEHVVATVSEWLVAFTSVLYFATFYSEFKYFSVSAPKVNYYNPEHSPKGNSVAPVSTIF